MSELSEVVGNYEKLRLQDQQAIQKLKDRLQQLDVENETLTRQISCDENRTPDNERDVGANDDETPVELKKQVTKLKGLLKIALDSSDKPLDIGKYLLSKIGKVYLFLAKVEFAAQDAGKKHRRQLPLRPIFTQKTLRAALNFAQTENPKIS